MLPVKQGKKICTFVEVDDCTPVQKLSVKDQLRVLAMQLAYDPAAELKAADAVTVEMLTLKADLSEFLNKSLRSIYKGEHKSVVVQVANKFRPVLMDVLKSPAYHNYFDIETAIPKVQYDIPFDVLVKFTVKES